MGKINVVRVLISGIVAGIVADILSFLVDGVWLAPRWASGLQALGRPGFGTCAIICFNLLGILGGIALIWIYAAIRPHFGAGVKTAIYAGVVFWVVGVLIPNVSFMWVSGLFSRHLTFDSTLGGLVEIVAGAIAGAYLYKE